MSVKDRSDYLNPILIKEVVQGMRTKSFAWAFIITQTILFLMAFFFLSAGHEANDEEWTGLKNKQNLPGFLPIILRINNRSKIDGTWILTSSEDWNRKNTISASFAVPAGQERRFSYNIPIGTDQGRHLPRLKVEGPGVQGSSHIGGWGQNSNDSPGLSERAYVEGDFL